MEGAIPLTQFLVYRRGQLGFASSHALLWPVYVGQWQIESLNGRSVKNVDHFQRGERLCGLETGTTRLGVLNDFELRVVAMAYRLDYDQLRESIGRDIVNPDSLLERERVTSYSL